MDFMIKDNDLNKARYSSPYGSRWGTKHRGIDIAIPVGTKLYSPLDGVVKINKVNGGGSHKGYGYYLSIYHKGKNIHTLYGHLKQLSHLKIGSVVKKGEFIGYSGNTGTSTGPHLHFEIHEGGFLFSSQVKNKDTAVDPVKYYPELNNYFNKTLDKNMFNKEVIVKRDDIVKFEQKWQSDQLIETLKSLGKKGLLNSADAWVKKFKDGKLTNSELGLISLSVLDRTTNK